MPPKKTLPQSAASSSPAPGKPAPARGTLQHLWANAPKPKSKSAPRPNAMIPRESMTLEESDEADRKETLRGGDLQLGGQLDGGDNAKDSVMRNAHGEVMRNRDGTPRLASSSPIKKKALTFGERMKKLAAQKEKEQKEKEQKSERMKDLVARSEKLEANEAENSGRRGLRKHASTSLHELPPSRKIGRSKTIRQTTEVDYDTDEAVSQTGRRSPRKHAGTPVPGSRAGTPRSGTPTGSAKDPNQKLKRAGSNLTKDSTKTRRTISPERKVRFSTEPSTPERNATRPDQEKTPDVENPAFDPNANFHKALVSPAKKPMNLPGNANSTSRTPNRSPLIIANIAAAIQAATKARSRSTTPSRQSPSIATNAALAFSSKPPVQNSISLKKAGKHARSLSATVESPERGKRSRTGTPRTTPPKPALDDDDSFLSDLGATPSPVKQASSVEKTPPKNATPSKKNKTSSFMLPLEDTPSPPPSMKPKPPVNGSSFTNSKSSQSHRTVVEDTDAESSDDSDDELPMAFHNPHSIPSIPRVPPPPARPAITNVLSTPGKERKYKFSLKTLVASMEDNERTNETAEKVTKMLAEKDAFCRNLSNVARGTITPHDGHAKLLEDVVKQATEAGGDDAQKVLRALKRANVTQGVEMVYHFFGIGERKMVRSQEFPKDLLDEKGPNKLWHEMFGDREQREVGLEMGLFGEMLKPEQAMQKPMFFWVLEELAKETNAALRHGYLRMLLDAPISIMELLTKDTVRRHFRALGAKKDATPKDKEVEKELVLEPVREDICPETARGNHWGNLNDFLELLGRTAILLSDEIREYALGIILRLCADKLVRTHISIQEAVQKALMLLSEAFETDEAWEVVSTRLSQTLYNTIPSPTLLLHLFASIPSRTRLHNLRRRLAYAYFLQNLSLLEEDMQSTFSIDNLTRHLETKKFQTSRDTKDFTYACLDADIQLLDIALDSGSSSTAPKLGQRHLYNALLATAASGGSDSDDGIVPPKLSAQEKEKERIFNEQCDALAQRLNIILNGIQDLGPGHAERSALRATIGAVRNRVECCVRTFVRQKVRRIGGGEGVKEDCREVDRREQREVNRGKKFLAGFLRRGYEERGGEGGLSVEAEAEMLLTRYT